MYLTILWNIRLLKEIAKMKTNVQKVCLFIETTLVKCFPWLNLLLIISGDNYKRQNLLFFLDLGLNYQLSHLQPNTKGLLRASSTLVKFRNSFFILFQRYLFLFYIVAYISRVFVMHKIQILFKINLLIFV